MQLITFVGALCICLVCSQSFLSRMETEVEDYCEATTNIRVQMLFIFDRTWTFFKQKNLFARVSGSIIEALNKKYPGSEYGLAVFADYDVNAGLTDIQTEREDRAGPGDCYTLIQPLTTQAHLLARSFAGITIKVGSNHDQQSESTLTAVTFGAADQKVGWEKNPRDHLGNVVRKIEVLATDATSTRFLKKTEGRHEVRGDGTDTCENTLPPSDEIVERVLKDNRVGLVGLYYTFNDTGVFNVSVLSYYNHIFGKMDIPYSQYEIYFNREADIAASIVAGVEAAVECEEDDPPAYNTLGL